ncbi:outer membrane protein assembly factor BamB [Caenimonas koreensis DSM 17982]|uniref:Outer membrane protein assembly factor BamB n=1 Tax=Caenimonas koreensis DSM 17982 TaxID=1121255 RepID=A0A844B2J8_9BURK|nr:outer membrane protein assembly factor BamB [Caenimonas koreensis]MRD45777.1 outer membrane protein assembly factor BamB [Caenimonas koreensis DSM 17982]
MTSTLVSAGARAASVIALAVGLAGCSYLPSMPSIPFFGMGTDKPKMAELAPNPSLIAVSQAWTSRVSSVGFPLSVQVSGTSIAVAGSDGTVALIDAVSGRDLWRASVGAAISAGVGSDGRTAAVVTRTNELVVLQAGRELWRQKLTAGSYTAPLVAGARVFVMTADRAVSAYDGQTGRKLWTQTRPGEPLVLSNSGVLLAVGDTLVAGLSGRLVGMNPLSGGSRWEAPLASPRGVNDVERLVDLVGTVSRVGDSICARAFQSSVGCVDAQRGGLVWTKPANGAQGVGGDDRLVFGTESDGKVVAWRRDNGERAWFTERLLHRGLTAPLALGRSVIIGDSTGLVHLLSRDDGSLLTRLATDGSEIATAPVVAANTLVVVTKNGGIFGFVPQ